MTTPYFGPFTDTSNLPVTTGQFSGPGWFTQPDLSFGGGGGVDPISGIGGILGGLGGPLSIALPALATLGNAAAGGPSNATSGGQVDTDFGDVQTANPVNLASGAFSVGGNSPTAGGTSLAAPVEQRGSQTTGGATGGLTGGNPNQAGPLLPGAATPFGAGGGAAARDDLPLYLALGAVALVVVVAMVQR